MSGILEAVSSSIRLSSNHSHHGYCHRHKIQLTHIRRCWQWRESEIWMSTRDRSGVAWR